MSPRERQDGHYAFFFLGMCAFVLQLSVPRKLYGSAGVVLLVTMYGVVAALTASARVVSVLELVGDCIICIGCLMAIVALSASTPVAYLYFPPVVYTIGMGVHVVHDSRLPQPLLDDTVTLLAMTSREQSPPQ
jgi:hypothetical protein